MTIASRVKHSEQLIAWLDARADDWSIPSNDRVVIAASCLHAGLEHHRGIVLAISHSLNGSAAALVRAEFEAYVKGVWLAHRASDAEVEHFKRDKLRKTFGVMIDEIEETEAFDVGVLSRIKRESWDAMCSYTHTGLAQIVRRVNPPELVARYSDKEVVEMLDFADSVALLATLATLNMTISPVAEREKLAGELLDQMRALAER